MGAPVVICSGDFRVLLPRWRGRAAHVRVTSAALPCTSRPCHCFAPRASPSDSLRRPQPGQRAVPAAMRLLDRRALRLGRAVVGRGPAGGGL